LGGAILNFGTLWVVGSTLNDHSAIGGDGGTSDNLSGPSESGGGGGPGADANGISAGLGGGNGQSIEQGDLAGGNGSFGSGGGGGEGLLYSWWGSGPGGAGGFGGGGGGGGGDWSPQAGGAGGFGGGAGAEATDYDAGGNGGGGAGLGGAIMNFGGTVLIVNSTLTANSAQGGAGANNGQGLGGAVFSRGGSLKIYNSTLDSNTVGDDGGAVYAMSQSGANLTFELGSSILSNTSNGHNDGVLLEDSGNIAATGSANLVESDLGMTLRSLVAYSADPQLGNLTDNGGPTKTMALDGGSDAIGNGLNLLTLPFDQRGVDRSRSGVVDIGALQLLSMPPTITSIARGTPSNEETNAGNVTFTITFDQDVIGVDAADFGLTGSAAGNCTILQVSGNGSIYQVNVSTLGAEGTLGLSVVTGGVSNAASQTFDGTVGMSETYSLDHVSPLAPLINSPENFTVTPHNHYTVAGTAAANALVKLYLDDDLVDSVQLTGGLTTFSFDAELRLGSNMFHVTATDRHGNVSPSADVSEIIRTQILAVGAAPGNKSAPVVKVYDAVSGELFSSFLAYESKFTGGVHVTTGDLDNDGQDEIIVAPASKRRTEVKVFSILGEELNQFEFIASKSTQKYGSVVAVGDVDGDGWRDIVLGAGSGQTSHIRVFKNIAAQTPEHAFSETPLVDFEAFTDRYKSGVSLAIGDVNDDGTDEIIVGTNAGYVTQVSVFTMTNALTPTFTQLTNFRPYGDKFKGGVEVSVGDLDGDGKAEIVTAPGAKGGSLIQLHNGETGATVGVPFVAFASDSKLAVNIVLKDLDGDGRIDELFAALAKEGTKQPIKRYRSNGQPSLRGVEFAIETVKEFKGGVNLG
jgi:hypothetical protein